MSLAPFGVLAALMSLYYGIRRRYQSPTHAFLMPQKCGVHLFYLEVIASYAVLLGHGHHDDGQ